jgi:hypothetical protein
MRESIHEQAWTTRTPLDHAAAFSHGKPLSNIASSHIRATVAVCREVGVLARELPGMFVA